MTHSARPKNCPVCGLTVTERFLRLKQVPFNYSAPYRSEQEAAAAPRGDVELALCRRCGMLYNAAFDSSRVPYNLTYGNTLSSSPAFRVDADALAKRLVSSYGLYEKEIIEIGCGDGDFLDRLCALGGNRGTGFDPGAASRTTPGLPEIVPGLFEPSEKFRNTDFVYCRHVLERVESPQRFLQMVRESLSRGGTAYFEVSNANSVLGDAVPWGVVYSHCSYFTALSLRNLFRSSAFDILNMRTTVGDQSLSIEARPSLSDICSRPENKGIAATVRLADQFETKLRGDILRWSRFIEYASVEGYRTVLWGAGTESVTFLNVVPGAKRLVAAVDINPCKQSTFIPGTGQSVISPERLQDYRPDVVIVLNSLNRSEVQKWMLRLRIEPIVVADARLPLPVKQRRQNAAAG